MSRGGKKYLDFPKLSDISLILSGRTAGFRAIFALLKGDCQNPAPPRPQEAARQGRRPGKTKRDTPKGIPNQSGQSQRGEPLPSGTPSSISLEKRGPRRVGEAAGRRAPTQRQKGTPPSLLHGPQPLHQGGPGGRPVHPQGDQTAQGQEDGGQEQHGRQGEVVGEEPHP